MPRGTLCLLSPCETVSPGAKSPILVLFVVCLWKRRLQQLRLCMGSCPRSVVIHFCVCDTASLLCLLSCAHISHLSLSVWCLFWRHCRVHLMQNNEEQLCQRRGQHDRSLASIRHLLRFGQHLRLGAHARQRWRWRRRRPGRALLQGATYHAEVPVCATHYQKQGYIIFTC